MTYQDSNRKEEQKQNEKEAHDGIFLRGWAKLSWESPIIYIYSFLSQEAATRATPGDEYFISTLNRANGALETYTYATNK